MPLDKDVLGLALYTRRNAFGDKTMDQLVSEYGDFEAVKLAMAKADAEEIINHIKEFGLVTTVGSSTTQTGRMA